jgi:LacI family gluconate utilization system Gnt-I transcriptional repressor
MNYVPDQLAGTLSTKKSGFVATLLPSLNNLHFALTVQSLTSELERDGLQILLGHTNYSRRHEEELVEAMLKRRPEAIVLSYDGHTDRTRKLLELSDIPVVEIWEIPDDPIGHTVGFSNRDESFAMTAELIRLGYARLTYVGENDDDFTRGARRRAGFEDAMRQHGLEPTRQVRFGPPPMTIDAGAAVVPELLERFPDTDCVVCVSDMAAFGVQSSLVSAGHSVPDNIGVAGFGNFEVSRFAHPALTTVGVDPEGIGEQAGRLISKLLNDATGARESVQKIKVGTTLLLRESTRKKT